MARGFGLTVATLRYYEEQGLVAPVARIGRVRYYDRAALHVLAYALLWHRDATLSLSDTREIMHTHASGERHERITQQICTLDKKIRGLQDARAALEHLLDCPADNPMTCPYTGEQLRRTVDRVIAEIQPH